MIRFFFLRTVFAILLSILLVVGGLLGYSSMVKESDPDVDIAIAAVKVIWVGADAATIEQEVTKPLELKIKSIAGLKSLRSASFSGFSMIDVEFDADADVTKSIQLVRDAVSQALPELPSEVEQPLVEQVAISDTPILTIAISGELERSVLCHQALIIEKRLENVSGVKETKISGACEEVVQIQLYPSRLLELGISPKNVADKIKNANQDLPLDEIESSTIGTQLRFYGKFRNIKVLEQLPITRLDSRIVRLNEIATVRRELEQENKQAFLSWNGSEYKPTISIAVKKVPGQDTIAIIDQVLKKIEQIQKNPQDWTHGIEYRVISNDAEIIWDKLSNLFANAVQAMLAVFFILFIALSWREALIAGISIPLTFLGALFCLWLTGQTLNNIVLIGMVLALGLLVDVFILMMEGMHEAIFVNGLSFDAAAIHTVKTYAIPAFAGQMTTIVAMTPLMAISGTTGKFIRLLPTTAIICLLLSLIIALLVDIPISRLLLNQVKNKKNKSRIDKISEVAQKRFALWSLNHTVRSKSIARAWSIGSIALFVCAVMAFTQIPIEFFPPTDGRKLTINIDMPATTTIDKSQKIADELGVILRKKKYFESAIKYVGQSGELVISDFLKPSIASYLLSFDCVFTPRKQREFDSYKYIDNLRTELQTVLEQYPGATLALNSQQTTTNEEPIQIQITGESLNELRRISGEIQMRLRAINGTTDVRDNLGDLQPDLKIVPKREALEFYGISEEEIAEQARYYTTVNDIGDFIVGGNEENLEIRLSTAWESRKGKVGGPTRQDELLSINFFNSKPGTLPIPADAIVETVFGEIPLSITHLNGQRTVTVLSNISNRTVGEILAELEPELEAMTQQWKEGYSYSFGGEVEEQSQTFGSAGQALLLAIFMVFAVLVLQFGSFSQPFIILLAIPFALIGTLGGFFLAWIPFSFSAFIGIIALTGIVVNDSIVMVDTMNNYRQKGMEIRRAAAKGAADRLRPILTTSITTIIGLIPLALSDSTWMPLCCAIIFGLIASTLISLVVVPGLYLQLTSNN
ncbi:MAG: efflux RND transporter permease subunit [Rivularia sp. (in: Bacteria)]|nr:efflux RND transporter permease subunit [Rivularia sp. MS3]